VLAFDRIQLISDGNQMIGDGRNDAPLRLRIPWCRQHLQAVVEGDNRI